jgi:dCMP deaminase
MSTCGRAAVGCVLVRDNRALSSGYNGAPSGYPHCEDDHDMRDGHCTRARHAEQNAICNAAYMGHATKGATAYVTHAPCWACASMLRNAGIVEIVYEHAYRIDPRIFNLGMTIRQLDES